MGEFLRIKFASPNKVKRFISNTIAAASGARARVYFIFHTPTQPTGRTFIGANLGQRRALLSRLRFGFAPEDTEPRALTE